MTVASETSRNDYVGLGTTATYSYSFRIFAATDLLVTQVTTAGVETELVYPTDYTVTGVGSFSGGDITLTAGNLTVGYGLTIRFRSTLTQNTDIRNQSGFFPEVLEDALDRLTKLCQQQQDELDRSIKLPETETGTMTLPTVTERRSSFLGFDTLGDPISGTALTSSVPATAFAESIIDDATAGEVIETLRNGLTALAVAPADDDEVLLRDTSATTGKRQTVANFIKSVLDTARAFTAAHTHAGAETHAGDETHSGLESFAKTKFSVPHGPNYLNNISIDATVAANALTLHILGNDGAVPSATNPAQLSFRNSSLTTGTTTVATATAATTVTAPDGATLGFTASEDSYLYVYALNNAGTVEAAVCGSPLDTNGLHSTTAISATADSRSVLYSTTARANVAIRFLGFIRIVTGATPGQWGTAATLKAAVTDAPPVLSVGHVQTWVDLTGSRALNTTYKNSTCRPIMLSVSVGVALGESAAMVVNGVTIGTTSNSTGGGYHTVPLTAIVPPGHTYSVATTGGTVEMPIWAELR